MILIAVITTKLTHINGFDKIFYTNVCVCDNSNFAYTNYKIQSLLSIPDEESTKLLRYTYIL